MRRTHVVRFGPSIAAVPQMLTQPTISRNCRRVLILLATDRLGTPELVDVILPIQDAASCEITEHGGNHALKRDYDMNDLLHVFIHWTLLPLDWADALHASAPRVSRCGRNVDVIEMSGLGPIQTRIRRAFIAQQFEA
jgi:hypothetical protein